MKFTQKFIITGAIAFGTLTTANMASALVIDSTSTDADTLAAIIAGAGVTISGATYQGVTDQSGAFSDGGVIGMSSGLIMTTGDANDAPGPNSSDFLSVQTGSGSDADLSAIVGTTTNDAAVLEFNFESATGDLFFQYVFASEEYNEFVDSSFNDVFAFFLDGTNIAIAPDGQVVSINTVNCGNPLSGSGPNCSYYNNNDLDDGGPFFDIEYDGFTDVFTASFTGLAAGSHTMKIAIADTSDASWDSAVFIAEGSFTGTDPSVPAPATLALFGLGLAGLGWSRRKKA